MDKKGLFDKNKILNFAIIILALFIAFQIYRSAEENINSLIRQKDDQLKKNIILNEISVLEKKIEKYKKAFVKKDLSSVMDTLSDIAKNNSINIISVKPASEEAAGDYVKTSFIITVNAASYHSLGDFISQLESSKDIYIVDELSVASGGPERAVENITSGLAVNLKISTISYL